MSKQGQYKGTEIIQEILFIYIEGILTNKIRSKLSFDKKCEFVFKDSKQLTELLKQFKEVQEENEKLKYGLNKIYNSGYEGIMYVGSANYASRESEAKAKLTHIYNTITQSIKQ